MGQQNHQQGAAPNGQVRPWKVQLSTEALEAGLNVEMPGIEPRYFGGYLLEQARLEFWMAKFVFQMFEVSSFRSFGFEVINDHSRINEDQSRIDPRWSIKHNQTDSDIVCAQKPGPWWPCSHGVVGRALSTHPPHLVALPPHRRGVKFVEAPISVITKSCWPFAFKNLVFTHVGLRETKWGRPCSVNMCQQMLKKTWTFLDCFAKFLEKNKYHSLKITEVYTCMIWSYIMHFVLYRSCSFDIIYRK